MPSGLNATHKSHMLCLKVRSSWPVVVSQTFTVRSLPVLRRALLLQGVDLPPGRQAWTSAAHMPLEGRETIEAFGLAIERLKALKCL